MGADPSTDLAVLKVKADNLPFVKYGNSDDVESRAVGAGRGQPVQPELDRDGRHYLGQGPEHRDSATGTSPRASSRTCRRMPWSIRATRAALW
ncbi:MAG: hypothetical protein WKG07_07345 [Hymenobacter sp.]